MAIGSPRSNDKREDDLEVHSDFADNCAFWLSRTQWVHFELKGDKNATGGFDLTTKTEEDVLRVAEVWSAASVACLSAGPDVALDTPRQTGETEDFAARSNADTRTGTLAEATATEANVALPAAKHSPEIPAALFPANLPSPNADCATPTDTKLDDADPEDVAVSPSGQKRARKKKKSSVTILLGGVPISSTNLRLLGTRLLQIRELRQRVLKWSRECLLRRLNRLTYVNKSRNTPSWWSVQMELQLFCGSCACVCWW